MRRRITRALLATTAAGATITALGLTAAGSAGASTTAHKPSKITFAPSAPEIATGGAIAGGHAASLCADANPAGATVNFFSPPVTPVGAAVLPQKSFGGGGCAGYLATDRTFRYAQAIVTIPQSNVIPLSSTTPSATIPLHTNAAAAAAPTMWVGLSSSDAVAGIGIFSCYNYVNTFLGLGAAPVTGPCAVIHQVGPPAGPDYFPASWVAVGWVDTSGGPLLDSIVPLTGLSGGDGVKLSVYYPAGGAAHFQVTTNPTGSPVVTPFQLPSGGNFFAVFDHADALVDYSSSATLTESSGVTPVVETTVNQILNPGPAPDAADLRISQFQTGAWTTTGGVRGTFHGPWTLSAPTLTSNGNAFPSGAVNVEPAYLWNDGIGNGWGDAFGVWWRH